jgi:hypothetical protein
VLAAGVALLAAVSAGMLAGGGAAVAMLAHGGTPAAADGGGSTPPWYSTETVAPEGFITFYNAQGQVVTGGNLTDSEMAAYAVASAPDTRTGDTKAVLYAYTPVEGENPLTWSGLELSLAKAYPNTSAPGGIGTTANPVLSGGADITLSDYIDSVPNVQTASGWTNLYDIRLEPSGPGQPVNPDFFYETAISVDVTGETSTGPTGTWSVDYPDWTQNTTTAVTASPPSESTSAPITLTATVTPTADSAGTVSFWTGYGTSSPTQVGATQTVSSSGTASVSATPPTGTTDYTAVFQPTIGSADIGSTGSLSYVVSVPQTATTTTLTGTPASPVSQGSSVTLTATEVAADSTNPAGNVQFFQGSTSLGTMAVNGSGVATLTTTALEPTAPAGTSVTATFTPTSSSYASSTSNALTYTVNPVAATPTISGKAQVGQTVKCNEPLSTGESATYSWQAGTKTIGSNQTLAIPASAYNTELTCTVSVSDGGGPASSATSATEKVALGPAPTPVKHHGPSLSGKAKVGKTLKVNAGKWSLAGLHFTYQWLLNGKVIKHATRSSFKLSKADKGKKISCRVTASLTGYASGTATTSSEKVSS